MKCLNDTYRSRGFRQDFCRRVDSNHQSWLGWDRLENCSVFQASDKQLWLCFQHEILYQFLCFGEDLPSKHRIVDILLQSGMVYTVLTYNILYRDIGFFQLFRWKLMSLCTGNRISQKWYFSSAACFIALCSWQCINLHTFWQSFCKYSTPIYYVVLNRSTLICIKFRPSKVWLLVVSNS